MNLHQAFFLKISSIHWPKSKHTPYTNIIESCLQLNIWQTWILHFSNAVYNWLTVCKAKHEWFFFHFGSGPLKFNPLFVKRIAILRNWYHTSRYRVTLQKWLYQQNTIHAFLYVNLCNFRFHDYKGHLKCWKDIKLFCFLSFAKISKNLSEKKIASFNKSPSCNNTQCGNLWIFLPLSHFRQKSKK